MNEEQHRWLVETLKINVKHAEVETDTGNDYGFIHKSKGVEYEGEEGKLGWRAQKKKQGDENLTGYRAAVRDPNSEHLVTRHYSDQEREENTRRVDAEGIVRDHSGNSAQGNRQNYVVDPKTGELVVGDEKTYVRETETGFVREAFGRRQDEAKSAYNTHGKTRLEDGHHTTMLRGQDVASAGKVTLKDGKVEKISNESGHYKPQFVHLLQVVEHLARSGAMLDTELVDYEGRLVRDVHPKAFALHKKLKPLLTELPGYTKRIKEIIVELESHEVDTDALEQERTALEKKTDLITKGLLALRKMGIGPRNKITGKVDFSFIDANMTGFAARSAKQESFETSDFLMGKGAPKVKALVDDDIGVHPPQNNGRSGNADSGVQVHGTTMPPNPDDDSDDDEESIGKPYMYQAEPSVDDENPDVYQYQSSKGGTSSDTVNKTSSKTKPDVPYRDFKGKGDVLEEMRQKTKDRRPEDWSEKQRRDRGAEIVKGRASDLNTDTWNQEVEGILDGLNNEFDEPDRTEHRSKVGTNQPESVSTTGYAQGNEHLENDLVRQQSDDSEPEILDEGLDLSTSSLPPIRNKPDDPSEEIAYIEEGEEGNDDDEQP